jgi:DNA-binding FadR family transcriptional regulator
MNSHPVFKPIKTMTLVEAVAEQIFAMIAAGHFRPGDRLPTEAELGQQLGVGRSTLREALKSLALAGLIETRRSAGTFVSESYSDFLSNLSWAIEEQLYNPAQAADTAPYRPGAVVTVHLPVASLRRLES